MKSARPRYSEQVSTNFIGISLTYTLSPKKVVDARPRAFHWRDMSTLICGHDLTKCIISCQRTCSRPLPDQALWTQRSIPSSTAQPVVHLYIGNTHISAYQTKKQSTWSNGVVVCIWNSMHFIVGSNPAGHLLFFFFSFFIYLCWAIVPSFLDDGGVE